MDEGLKLYVWTGVLTDFSSGIAFALAHSVEEARRMVKAEVRFESWHYEFDSEPYVHDQPVAYAVEGGG